MEFLEPMLAQYILDHTDPEPELLKEINRETNSKVLMPRMLSGHFQGRVLSMLSKMIRPQRVLEIGTYTGYSALCLCEGLQENGKLITLDINEELEEMVRGFFKRSLYEQNIDYRVGDALKIIPNIKEDFDLVFIDADKINYARYYDLVFDRVKQGGYIIADNVLWSGKVVGNVDKTDKDTEAIRAFNKKIHEDHRVEHVLFSIRDGLMIIRKK